MIAQYALNKQCEFDLKTAINIEKAIFGAKKVATEELVKNNELPTQAIHAKGYYDLNLNTVNLTETLNNIFYQLRKNHHTHRIQNPKIYLFGALKKMMKEWIQLDYDVKQLPKVPIIS